MKDEILAFLKERKEELFAEFRLVKLGLIGSFAKDMETDQSDIDLIVEFAPNTPDLSEKKNRLKLLISNHFHRNVDLCREKYMKPYFKAEILKSAIYV